jgi:DNA primase
MLDPYTGEPPYRETRDPKDDPANYYAVGNRGRETPLNLNNGNRDLVIELLRDSVPEGDPITPQGKGNVTIRCPFHADNTPSCSVDPVRRGFHCFGCGAHGQFRELIAKLRGVAPGEAVGIIGRALGAQVVFRDPDSKAEAIYDYRDANGNLVKQVLRYPGKRFLQRRRDRNGSLIWDTEGVGPILYNLMRVQLANTVCICEGEKDCDTFNGLSLHPASGGDVIATTSGGAESWHDQLADELRGKRIVLMPDDDEAGARFAENVAASLLQRGILYRTVTFGDVGAKDLSDFLALGRGREEVVERIGGDWVSVAAPSLFTVPAEFEPA